MRRTRLLLVAQMMLLLVGCIADEVGGVYLVNADVDELPSSKDYGAEVFFQAGDSWRAWSSEAWLSVIPNEGESGRNGIILRTMSANRSRERRQATVIIESGGKQQTVTVWQRNDYALFDQRTYKVEAQGGEVNMTFESNVAKDSLLIMYLPSDWYAWDKDSLKTRAADWRGNIKTLYVKPNPSRMERSAYIMLVRKADRRIDYQVMDTTWVYQAGDSLGMDIETERLP
ncbi:MAG: BACON domain-containing protein [Prevotella sp.]|nr:BACON domain-containing protein [Prevotella sp.]